MLASCFVPHGVLKMVSFGYRIRFHGSALRSDWRPEGVRILLISLSSLLSRTGYESIALRVVYVAVPIMTIAIGLA